MAYITGDELRTYIGSQSANFSDLLDTLCDVASTAVDDICGRTFVQDSSVSARYFDPVNYWSCPVDDISTTSGLIVETDDNGDGTYPITWTYNTDFFLEPINQRQGAIGGWPYTELAVLNTRAFMKNTVSRRKLVKVTAQWGWADVPDAVVQATKVAGARLFKLKDAPDGFIGIDGFGPVRVKENPEVKALLRPYMKSPVVVA